MEQMKKFDIRYFEEHYQDGGCSFEEDGMTVSMMENEDSYEIHYTPKSPSKLICTRQLFYPDTLTLMREGQFLKHGGELIGKWVTYDKFGDVIEEIDEDEGWKYTWKDIEAILLREGYRLETINGIEKKVEEETVFLWIVSFGLGMSNGVLTYHGNTGRLLWSEEEFSA